MEENLKNKYGFWVFFIIVFLLGVGGYFFTDYVINMDDKKTGDVSNNKEIIDYRIDKEKEYIYFTNEEVISDSDEAEIYYKDVVINLSTQEGLTNQLKKENEIYKNNIKYLDDGEYLSEELITYNFNNLYSLTFREYDTYQYNDYVSLVINEHNYSCFDLITFIETKSYIFNIKNGKLMEEKEILSLYNTTIEKIKENIKIHLEEEQEIVDEVELIKIEDTINNLDGKYSLYIDNYGNLYISFLVKTTQVDYNEIMEV